MTKLVPARPEHLDILKHWISDQSAAYYWGGPGLRYPFTDESFREDIKWQKLSSCSLVAENGELLGFGQYYDNHGRCHLARLIISPDHRGCGLGRFLISELIEAGLKHLQLDECSLFVINSNERAIRCYRSLNFHEAEWPDWMKRCDGVSYMILPR